MPRDVHAVCCALARQCVVCNVFNVLRVYIAARVHCRIACVSVPGRQVPTRSIVNNIPAASSAWWLWLWLDFDLNMGAALSSRLRAKAYYLNKDTVCKPVADKFVQLYKARPAPPAPPWKPMTFKCPSLSEHALSVLGP